MVGGRGVLAVLLRGDGADLHTVAHEAAHVVQQRGGVQLKGGVGQVGDVYERHADAVADRVVAGESAADLLGTAAATPGAGGGPPVQRKPIPGNNTNLGQEYTDDRGGPTMLAVPDSPNWYAVGQSYVYHYPETDQYSPDGSTWWDPKVGNKPGQDGFFLVEKIAFGCDPKPWREAGSFNALSEVDQKRLTSIRQILVQNAKSGRQVVPDFRPSNLLFRTEDSPTVVLVDFTDEAGLMSEHEPEEFAREMKHILREFCGMQKNWLYDYLTEGMPEELVSLIEQVELF